MPDRETVGQGWIGDDWSVAVRVQPKASRSQVVGPQGGKLKVALTSPPIDGAANKALCQLLAKALGVAKGRVTIRQGEKSREKWVQVQGAPPEAVARFCRRHGLESKEVEESP